MRTPIHTPASVSGPAGPVTTCAFDCAQGMWHVACGKSGFYSPDLRDAIRDARERCDANVVEITTTSEPLNAMLRELGGYEPASPDRDMTYSKMFSYCAEQEIPLGSDDLALLAKVECRETAEAGPRPTLVAAEPRVQAFGDAADPLVVPVDTPGALREVFGVAAYFAERLGTSIEYVHVATIEAVDLEELCRFVEIVDELAAASTVPVGLRVVLADSGSGAFLDTCRDRLICMKSHATPFQARRFVESHAAALLRHSTRPVILLGPNVDASRTPVFSDICMSVGGEINELALGEEVRQLAEGTGLEVRCVHVSCRDGDHEASAVPINSGPTPFDGLNDFGEVQILQGTVAELPHELLRAARASVIAMATHARIGLDRIARGSTLFDVVSASTQPVFAVGPRVGQAERTPPAVEPVSTVTDLGEFRDLVRQATASLRSEIVFAPS